MPPIIRIENLSKSYRIVHGQPRASYRTFREALTDLALAPLRRLRNGRRSGKLEEFWALKDVSLEVQQGEVLGIIGRNGAGKSTLLKILSRITPPTLGRAEIRGRVGSLLEVGTGFHPELSGRENIYLNGAILGMRRREIQRKFDEIVDFSGVEKFLDTPVKRYSSGMYVRLAFAVAAHLDPEILIIDEVLAVGDLEFQKKCLGKMENVAHSGRTVLFVSHNMAAVLALCTSAIVLTDGAILFAGAARDATECYALNIRSLPSACNLPDASSVGSPAWLTRVSVRSADGLESDAVSPGEPVELHFSYRTSQPGLHLVCTFGVYDLLGRKLLHFSTSSSPALCRTFDGTGTLVCRIRRLPLVPGDYRLNVSLSCAGQRIHHIRDALLLRVIPSADLARNTPFRQHGALFITDHEWRHDSPKL